MYDHSMGCPIPICGNDIFYMQIWRDSIKESELTFKIIDVDKKHFNSIAKKLNQFSHENFSFVRPQVVKSNYKTKCLSITTHIKDFDNNFDKADQFVDMIIKEVMKIWESEKPKVIEDELYDNKEE